MKTEKSKISVDELVNKLNELNLKVNTGTIIFNMADISVQISTTDTVGITLQSWLKQFFIDRNYYFHEPENTQIFPDFYLDNDAPKNHMLEVKAFNYNAVPAFDIANFDSYCDSVKEKPYRLNADYLIFGYTMSPSGIITVQKIWSHKIWEIAGTSKKYPLKTQVKRGMIYNIRPNSEFKRDKKGPFKNKDQFLKAIYDTLKKYRGDNYAEQWKNELSENYLKEFSESLPF